MKKKPPQNPYPGLRPFEFGENHLFFGREGQSEDVLQRLTESHFVAVVGTSGSGKSSLVRAGLLPLLHGGNMVGAGARWRVALFRPGDDPIHNLSIALTHPPSLIAPGTVNPGSVAGEDIKLDIAETVLRRSAVGLRDYAASQEFASDENLLVVVDQFEELFRFKAESRSKTPGEKSATQENAENEAAAFVKLLLETTRDVQNRVYVVITMRSDFLGDCSQFRDLPEAINNGQYLIPRLTTEQLKKAIESPAKVKGSRIQPALVARLLNDIGDDQDQLPVLQHALMRTWDTWEKDENRGAEITFDHYTATGGMATALSEHANEAFDELGDGNSEVPSRKQEIAEKLFRCLTETDRENRETRRATSLGKICAIAGADIDVVSEVINVFRRPGRTFLMPPFNEKLNENTLIDISHESLIRKWDQLKKWVADEAEAAQTYRRLSEDALLHQKGHKGFWGDPELTKTLEWKETFKPNSTWAHLYHEKGGVSTRASFDDTIKYLDESRADRDRELADDLLQRDILRVSARNLRWAVAALVVALVVTSGLVIYTYSVYAEALRAKNDLVKEKTRTDALNTSLTDAKKTTDDLNTSLVEEKKTTDELNTSLREEKKKTDDLNTSLLEGKKNAEDLNKRLLAEKADKEAAFESLRAKKEELETALGEQKKATEKAERAGQREQFHLAGMLLLEKREHAKALGQFESLRSNYEAETEIETLKKTEGVWWGHHNIGNIHGSLGNFPAAETAYIQALGTLQKYTAALRGPAAPATVWRNAAFRPENKIDDGVPGQLLAYQVATKTRLAQLYRDQALKAPSAAVYDEMNRKAAAVYNDLNKLVDLDENESRSYRSRLKEEIADFKSGSISNLDLPDAARIYEEAISLDSSDPLRAVTIYQKFSRILSTRSQFDMAEQYANKAIGLRHDDPKGTGNIKLPAYFYDNHIADSYNLLFEINNARAYAISQKINELMAASSRVQAVNDKSREDARQLEIQKQEVQNRARAFSDLANAMRRVRPDSLLIHDTYSQLARAYLGVGKCEEANEIYMRLLTDLNPQDIDYYGDRVRALGAIAAFYQEKRQNVAAADGHYRQLIATINSVEFENYLLNVPEGIFYDLSSHLVYDQTLLLVEGKKFDLNEKMLLRLMEIYQKRFAKQTANGTLSASEYGIDNASAFHFDALLELAANFKAQGKWTEARQQYETAITFLGPRGHPIALPGKDYVSIRYANVNGKLGDLIFRHGVANEATTYFQRSIEQYSKYRDVPWFRNYPVYLEGYANSLYIRGKSLLAAGDRRQAGLYFEQTIGLMNLFSSINQPFGPELRFAKDRALTPEFFEVRADILNSWSGLLTGVDDRLAAEKRIEAMEATNQANLARKEAAAAAARPQFRCGEIPKAAA